MSTECSKTDINIIIILLHSVVINIIFRQLILIIILTDDIKYMITYGYGYG